MNLASKIRNSFLYGINSNKFLFAFYYYVVDLINSNSKNNTPNYYKLLIVTPPSSSPSWILEGICNEVIKYIDSNISYKIVKADERLPEADNYFYLHYMYFINHFINFKIKKNKKIFIFVTHLEPAKHEISNSLLASTLALTTGIICMNTNVKNTLINYGISNKKIVTAIGGADSELFQPHQRNSKGKIGFCSAFYLRKSPDLLLKIIESMPHRDFILIGRGWSSYKKFNKLISCQNLKYIEANYADYPLLYKEMSVFVSVSELEGGPIPLIEAMMSNVVPVASNTGFISDVIINGYNGFIFENNSDPLYIINLIEEAFKIELNISSTVIDYDWKSFSKKIMNFIIFNN